MILKSDVHNLYFGKRDFFYYLEVADKSVNRDNQISELFGEDVKKLYHTSTTPNEFIYCAKFWKDKDSIQRFVSYRKKDYFKLKEISREEFINIIPEKSDVGDVSRDLNYIKNLESKHKEQIYSKAWSDFRKKYKCIEAYRKVSNPTKWMNCKDCGLIPLVWEFNNGRSTGCGCGENEYRHHSIHAESIMSWVKRHNGSALGYNSDELRTNWNHWVKTGEDNFKKQKEENSNIW
jgi:hypothetical protein